jgi:hypothetical protein
MKYMYIPIGIKGELVKSVVDCDKKWYVVGIIR